jgi:nitrogen-specific signal transduction histidine kinase/CheY-like chemotaxis protein
MTGGGADDADALRARLVEAERALADARAEAERAAERLAAVEAASARKTRFIGNVSHEFRTPLGSIIGFVALLARGGDELTPERRAEYLEIVQRNARHLLHVVNDLLNLSKVEAGTLEVSVVPVRTVDVAAGVISSLAPQAAERAVDVRLEDRATRPVLADAGRLRQTLLNLLENAIKYSPVRAEVVVRTLEVPDGVRIEIQDRGPGIEPEARPRLFKAFSRANPPESRVVGAGLGLALARMFTEAMDGRIGVESEAGEGSTFWLVLPAASGPVAPEAAPIPYMPRGEGQRVAVVDDDDDARAYAVAALASLGYRTLPDTGAVGVGGRLAAERPDAVLLDLYLGDRHGTEVLAELRRERPLADVPVIAFSGAEVTAPREAGFVAALLKPATPTELARCVYRVLADGPGAGGAGDTAPGAEGGHLAEEREHAEGDAEFLAPLRARFRAGLPARLAELEACAAVDDREGMVRCIHKLRGAAGGYGYERLAAAAGRAEDVLRGGGSADRAGVAGLAASIRALAGEGTE